MLLVSRHERRRKRFDESLNPGFYVYKVRGARERTSRGQGGRAIASSIQAYMPEWVGAMHNTPNSAAS